MKLLFKTFAALMLMVGMLSVLMTVAKAQEIMATPVPIDTGWIREFANLIAQIITQILREILDNLNL